MTFGFTTPSRPAVLRPAGEDEDGTAGAGAGPFPAAGNRLRLSVDAGATPGLTGLSPARKRRYMQLGLVGLGKMGFNMRERLREGGHEVIGYDPRPEVTDVPTLAGTRRGARGAPGRVGDGAVRIDHRRPRSPTLARSSVRGRPGDRRWQLALHRGRTAREDAGREGNRLHRRRCVGRNLGTDRGLRPDGRRQRRRRRTRDADLRHACARLAHERTGSSTRARSARVISRRWCTTASSTR